MQIVEDIFHHSFENNLFLSFLSLFRCFVQVERSQESDRKLEDCSEAYAHMTEHICPFAPKFQVMLF